MADIHLKFIDHSNMEVVASYSILRELSDSLSFEVDNARFHPKVKAGIWNGLISMIDQNNRCGSGLVQNIKRWCDTFGYTFSADEELLVTNPVTRDAYNEWVNSLSIKAKGEDIKPHWYQDDSVYHAIVNKRGVLNLPTSAGKSLIITLMSKFFIKFIAAEEEQILVIVPSIDLVTQMRDDMIDYGLFKATDIQCVGGNHTKLIRERASTVLRFTFEDGTRSAYTLNDSVIINGKTKALHLVKEVPATVNGKPVAKMTKHKLSPKIIISTWQSAIDFDQDTFDKIGLLMNDEAHLATGQCLTSIIKRARTCEYKFGLTGSLKDGKANILQYEALFGPTFKPVTTRQLMDEGQVTNLKITSIFLKYPEEICKRLRAAGILYQQEIEFITKYTARNRFVAKVAAALALKDENSFVMFGRIAHGKALVELIREFLPEERKSDVMFIAGEVKPEDREIIKAATEHGKGKIVVASYKVFAAGISIRNLHHVHFAHPVKSKVTVLQSIGRTLRKHDSKDVARVWDYVDDMGIEHKKASTTGKKYVWENYALIHAMERLERYISEEFDYSIKEINL